jgi:hypothetical protein
VIDDYSESWINSAYELNELIDPHTVSDSVNLCVQLLKSLGGKAEVLGRTCDLKSAYRQLAVSDESACFSIIVVFNTAGAGGKGSLEYYLQRALPFGAVASVVAFNRFSRLLWRIAVTTLKLHITNYFDDFIMLSTPELAMNAWLSFEKLLLMCGVSFATDERKRKPWSSSFSALGVSFRLDKCTEGIVSVENTSARKEELSAAIDEILLAGTLPPAKASSLAGRLQYAERQIYGPAACQVVRVIRQHGLSSAGFRSIG